MGSTYLRVWGIAWRQPYTWESEKASGLVVKSFPQVECPHCNKQTTTAQPLCEHCGAYLHMSDVLIASSCQTSVVDAATVGLPGDVVILMTFDGYVDSASDTPTHVVIAVLPDDVPRVRTSLLDCLMTAGVRIENGKHCHDKDYNSPPG